MDSSEYLKYVTEKVVGYIDRNRSAEDEPAEPAKLSKEPWLTKWFGVAPLGVMLWWNNRSEEKSKTRPKARSANMPH